MSEYRKIMNAQELHNAFWDFAANGEIQKIADLCGPDFKLYYDRDRHDTKGMIELLSDWRQSFTELGAHREVLHTFQDGYDKFCVVYDMSATHDGPFTTPQGQAIQPSGRNVTMRICDIVTCRDGQIQEWQVIGNDLDVLRQIIADSPR